MANDTELLRRYAREGCDESFRLLVQRHFDFVYSAAIRQVGGDTHLAKDVSQAVFTALARKAGRLSRHRALEGWLYLATRNAAAQAVRNEVRWRAKGVRAATMSGPCDPVPSQEIDWERVRPLLETALFELGDVDREALLIRFFKGRPYAEVGAALGLTRDAARMRVDRALERLRARFEGLGVTSSASALAALLASQAVAAAPVGMAASAAGAALAGAAGGASAGVGVFMSLANLKTGFAGVLLVAGVATGIAESRQHLKLEGEARVLAGAPADLGRAERENTRLRKLGATLSASVSGERAVAEALRADLAQAQMAGTSRRQSSARIRTAGEASSEPTFDVGSLDQLPFAIDQVRPQFPHELKIDGRSGQVLVDFVVGADGNVVNAHAVPPAPSASGDFVVAASGQGAAGSLTDEEQKQLDAAAVDAVSQWIFEPGQKAGSAVNTHMQVPIIFTLDTLPTGQAAPAH